LPTTDPVGETKLGRGGQVRTADFTLPLEHPECPVDMQRLREVSGDAPEQLREMIELYFTEANDLIPKLSAAVQASKAEEVEGLAHRLVGASANCGMISIVARLRELERMGRSRRLNGAEALCTAVIDQLNRIEQFLAAYVQSP